MGQFELEIWQFELEFCGVDSVQISERTPLVQGKGKGKWREANRRRQLQTAIHPGVMPNPPLGGHSEVGFGGGEKHDALATRRTKRGKGQFEGCYGPRHGSGAQFQ